MNSGLIALIIGLLVGATLGLMVGSWLERNSQMDRSVAQHHFKDDMANNR